MKTLLLALALTVQSVNPALTTGYDKFSDTSSAVLTEAVPSLSGIVDLGGGSVYVKPGGRGAVYLTVIGVSAGRRLTRDAKVSIAFTSSSKDWVYLKQINTFRILMNDTERFDLGRMTRTNSDVVTRGDSVIVSEQIAVIVPFSLIERLSKAHKIEMQIGQDEFQLEEEILKDLKEWVALFPTAKA